MKWLNYFVQGEDHVVIEKGSDTIVITVESGGEVGLYVGDSVEDALDLVMAEFSIPAV